ncbi:hypothetical protein ACFL21_03520 [Patescibacteria group bacterium]
MHEEEKQSPDDLPHAFLRVQVQVWDESSELVKTRKGILPFINSLNFLLLQVVKKLLFFAYKKGKTAKRYYYNRFSRVVKHAQLK